MEQKKNKKRLWGSKVRRGWKVAERAKNEWVGPEKKEVRRGCGKRLIDKVLRGGRGRKWEEDLSNRSWEKYSLARMALALNNPQRLVCH